MNVKLDEFVDEAASDHATAIVAFQHAIDLGQTVRVRWTEPPDSPTERLIGMSNCGSGVSLDDPDELRTCMLRQLCSRRGTVETTFALHHLGYARNAPHRLTLSVAAVRRKRRSADMARLSEP
jgi:hypothetical protein